MFADHKAGMKLLERSCEGELAGGACKHRISGGEKEGRVRLRRLRAENTQDLKSQRSHGSILYLSKSTGRKSQSLQPYFGEWSGDMRVNEQRRELWRGQCSVSSSAGAIGKLVSSMF